MTRLLATTLLRIAISPAGMGISFAGFKCQQVITATAYSIVGVMNKMLTVLINVLIWDKHASAIGIGSLAGAAGGGERGRQIWGVRRAGWDGAGRMGAGCSVFAV